MSGHYYRVGLHGPPNPDEHPWVMWRDCREAQPRWHSREVGVETTPGWLDTDEWFPVEAPPSELAPEPEGVEVDGQRWRLTTNGNGVMASSPDMLEGDWRFIGSVAQFKSRAHVAQALGLVDQPPVPRALVTEMQRWISDRFCDPNVRYAATTLLGRIEAGEFGPVEGDR